MPHLVLLPKIVIVDPRKLRFSCADSLIYRLFLINILESFLEFGGNLKNLQMY